MRISIIDQAQKKREKIKPIKIFEYIIYILSLGFLSFILFSVSFSSILGPIPPTRFSRPISLFLLFFIVLLSGGLFVLAKNHLNVQKKLKSYQIALLFFLSAVILAVPFLLTTNIIPKGDFSFYYETAKLLIQNGKSLPKYITQYVATFPHIFIFPVILSWFFRLFGSSLIVAQLVGVFFSTLSVVLVYIIGEKTLGTKFGVWAALLWLLLPSRTLYALLICTENIFNALGLFIIYIFLHSIQKTYKPAGLVFFGITGILFSLLASIRPNGLIIMVACLLLYLLFYNLDFGHYARYSIIIKVGTSLIVILAFLLTNFIINRAIRTRIDEEIPRNSIGWNLFVGMNQDSGGRWNGKDSQLFSQVLNEKGPEETQNFFYAIGMERLQTIIDQDNLFEFMLTKTRSMWFADHESIYYASSEHEGNFHMLINFQEHEKFAKYLFNSYYYFLLLLSILSIVTGLKQKSPKYILILGCLILLGTVILHIPFEVAMRYKNHVLIWFCFLAADSSWPC